jgi:glycosyltransferase involved in cell wall biosynthesis
MRVIELGLAEMADTTIVVSSAEEKLLNKLMPELSVAVVSNVHREQDLGPIRSERDGLMFVGNFHHPPNQDAMRWFVAEIFPLVTAALPQTMLRIIGSDMPTDIAALVGPNIENLGWVEDLAPVYHRTAIAVAPLRFGAGVKGKIGEALSYGIPVVSTGVGVEGMNLHDGVDICVRENPASFAAAIVSILSDDAEWNALAVNGRRAIHEMLGVEPAKRRLEQLLIHN